eukprot:1191255-Prorocentrum_minimum.AAC.7
MSNPCESGGCSPHPIHSGPATSVRSNSPRGTLYGSSMHPNKRVVRITRSIPSTIGPRPFVVSGASPIIGPPPIGLLTNGRGEEGGCAATCRRRASFDHIIVVARITLLG